MRRAPGCREDGTVSGSRARLALLVAVVAGSLAAPARAEDSAPIHPTAEAWYASGTGTLLAPLRPAGTLHVGVAGGQETDRTYLRFDVSGAVDGDEVDGVRLTVPVAVDDGTQAPETAEILACRVAGTVADGTEADPPEVDCDGAPEASFVDGDAPSFTVDLPPPTDGVIQVALVPGGNTWHVAFDSRTREDARPAALVVSSPPAAPPTAPTPTPSTPPTPAPPSPTPAADAPVILDTPPGMAVPDLTPEPASAGQVVADEAAAPPAAVTAVPTGGSSPFRYPAVFALPIVLLVVLGVAGDGLTRPVRLRADAR